MGGESPGSARPSQVFDTQAEAIAAATKAASKSKSEVIVHDRTGQMKQTVSKLQADELMLRAWKKIHTESSESDSKVRKASTPTA